VESQQPLLGLNQLEPPMITTNTSTLSSSSSSLDELSSAHPLSLALTTDHTTHPDQTDQSGLRIVDGKYRFEARAYENRYVHNNPDLSHSINSLKSYYTNFKPKTFEKFLPAQISPQIKIPPSPAEEQATTGREKETERGDGVTGVTGVVLQRVREDLDALGVALVRRAVPPQLHTKYHCSAYLSSLMHLPQVSLSLSLFLSLSSAVLLSRVIIALFLVRYIGV